MSAFSVVEAEFGDFEISTGVARFSWRYFAGDSKHKYCDGCAIRVDEKDALSLICCMSMTSVYCKKDKNGLSILYSNGIPVAYRNSNTEWWPFTNGWHKKKLEEYLGR